MRWLILLLCSPGFAIEPTGIADYVRRFQDASGKHIGVRISEHTMKRVRFELGSLDKTIDGKCGYRRNSCSLAIIYIDSKTWRRASDLYREMLVFHELGHCLLGYNDANSGMMNTNVDAKSYLIHRDEYHRELFEKFK